MIPIKDWTEIFENFIKMTYFGIKWPEKVDVP